MRYIESIFDDKINFRISLCCKIHSDYTPEEIAKSFKKHQDVKEYKTIKNRIEYLDKELRGVQILKDGYELTILPSEIRLYLKKDFNTVYEELKSYFQDTIISLPDKNEFYVESIIIYPKNESSNIEIDETKTSKGNKMFHQQYFDKNTSITGYLGQIDHMVGISFAWENKKYNYNEVFKYFEEVIKKDILILI